MSSAAQTEPAGDRQWKAQLGRATSRRARAEAEFYAAVAEVDAHVPRTEIAAVLHTTQDNVSRWAARGRRLRRGGRVGLGKARSRPTPRPSTRR